MSRSFLSQKAFALYVVIFTATIATPLFGSVAQPSTAPVFAAQSQSATTTVLLEATQLTHVQEESIASPTATPVEETPVERKPVTPPPVTPEPTVVDTVTEHTAAALSLAVEQTEVHTQALETAEPEPAPQQKDPPSAQASAFLALHNEVRAGVGVQSLQWSTPLAADALRWAETLADEDQCALRHSNEPYGENLFSLWSSDGSIRGTPDDAMDWWAGEVDFYDYETDTCEPGEVCGHYTQVVWAKTTHVGCASVQCSDGDGATDLFVCRYSPQGNILGQKPY